MTSKLLGIIFVISLKKEVLLNSRQQFLRIIRFCLGGVVGVSSGYITLYVLTEYFGLWYLWSSIVANVLNYLINFIMQKFWTFKNKNTRAIPKQISLYLGLAILFFVTNTGLMYVFVEYGHIQYMISQIILTVLLSVVSYFTTKLVFKE